jgi:hypothetical protein
MLLTCCWEEATGGEKKEQESKGKRGRPSSVEVDALKMQLAQETAEIDEDYKRVLKLVPK